MMLKTAPDPIDVQELQFKLHCRLKVFDNVDNANFGQHCNLVACASRFGLIFVGTNASSIQAIQLNEIEKCSKSDGDKGDYIRRNFPLPSPPLHVSVNCEHTVLGVVIERGGCPWGVFYDTKSFYQQDVVQVGEIRLSPTPSVSVTEINWNPAIGSIFTACKSDGTLGIYELKNTGIDINELPAAAGATCFCWSPKGKQIAVGSRDGKITQLKPDLKAVKVINSPPLKEPHCLKSLQWVSNYQFIGAFHPLRPDGQTQFIVVDAPKTGDPTYINYDDICYSNGNVRPVQFFMILVQNWNILMAASSNSMEVGILGVSNNSWTQWIMGDAARAELPLSANHQETLPIGCALDTGRTQPIPWGEGTLPPAPLLLLFSHHGTLCCFNIINLKEGNLSICSPPEQIKDTSGLQHFVAKGVEAKSIVKEAPKVAQVIPQTPTSVKSSKSETSTSNLNTSSGLFKQESSIPKTQSVNLFGGQTTLTSISPATKNTQASFMSQYQSPFLSFSSGEVKNVTTAPVVVQTSTVSTSAPPVKADVTSTTSVTTQPELNSSEVSHIDLKADEEAEKIFAQMVKEECLFLESELRSVLHQGKNMKLVLGSDVDKTTIVESTKSLEDFFREIGEIWVTQNAEVHILKQNLLQSFAWYEEAKSRHLASEDESLMMLIRSQPLDSASEKQLADIQHTNYYLESQISQIHLSLDEQWENFQDYCKKTQRIQIPTMEMIFQTMVKQNAILRKQNYILKDIANRIKNKSRSTSGPPLLISVSDVKDMPDLTRLKIDPEDVSRIQYEQVMNKMKNFTKKKSNNLRSFLKKREYPHVSAIKPQLSSSIIQASPISKVKETLLKTTPLVKEITPKKLDFLQGSEKSTVAKPEVKSESNATPIEGLQNFALKFEAKHFSNLNEKTFTPLASSPNSAFVSTNFVNNTPSTLSTLKTNFLNVSTTATAPSAVKSMPKFVVVTTTETQPVVTSISKPFSFISSATSISSQENTNASKPSSGIFATSTPKPSFSFNVEAKTTSAITSAFSIITAKPSTSFNVAQTTKFVTTAPPKSTSLGFTTPASSTNSLTSFSFAPASTEPSVFASTSQKPSEPSATTAKPFVFSSKTTTVTTITTQSVVVPKSTNLNTSQSSNFGSLGISTNSGKSTNSQTFFGTPLTTVTSKSTPVVTVVPSSSISDTVASTSIATTQATITTSSVASTQSLFSAIGMKTTFTSAASSTTTVATTSLGGTANVSITPVLPTAASKPSIFGSANTTTTSSSGFSVSSTTGGFASASSSNKPLDFGGSDSKPPSIFSSVEAIISSTSGNQSIFGGATSTPSATQSSIFGGIPSTLTTATSVFGTTTATPSTGFGVSTTRSSIFGTPSSTSAAFGTSTVTSSVFGTPTTPTTQSVFGTPSTTTQSLFGTPTTNTQSVFGTPTTSSTQSLFGTPVSTTTTSLFGISTPSTVQSIFGSTTSNSGTLFGNTSTSTVSQAIFGKAMTTTSQSQGFQMFGDGSQKTSIFGSTPSNSFQNQPSVFGGTATVTTSSVFGQPQTTSNTFGQSVFGNSFGSSSVFGNTGTSSFGQSGGSLFATTTSGSIFGGSATTGNTFSTTGTIFGAPASSSQSPFGSGNLFSTTTQSSSFGFGSLNVGSTPTTSSFGASASNANPFGGEKSVFGGSSANSGSSAFGSGGTFGGSSQGFGGSFGSQAPFTQQQSNFGQGSFGSGSFGSSSGPFSGGGGGVGQTGFGTTSTFQKPEFGSSPVFGGSPSFGSAPSFGGAPTFGSASTFGNTSKIFGGGGNTFGGGSSPQTAGFGNLANQQTVGFGNLAQQAANSSANAPFSGNSSFSSWR